MPAQNPETAKASSLPARTLVLFSLFIAASTILLVLLITGQNNNSKTEFTPKQNPTTKGQLYSRVIDLTYELPADSKNPMRAEPQVLTTKEGAQIIVEQISQKLKENPGLTDQDIASLSAGRLLLSFYNTNPASGSADLLGSVTTTLLKEGVFRITQLLTLKNDVKYE